MQTDVAAFLAKQPRFQCERLNACLTAQQCEANRQRTPEIFACIDCAGLGKAIELEERVMSESKCECGVAVHVKATGECRSCYDKRKHLERKAKREAEKVVEVKPPVKKTAPLIVPTEIEGEVKFTGECAGCGKPMKGERIWIDECPFCMANPVTGEPAKVPKNVAIGLLPSMLQEIDEIMEEHVCPEISRLSSFLPIVSCPPGRVIHLPVELSSRMTRITDDDVVSLLDMLVHGELERHPQRRTA